MAKQRTMRASEAARRLGVSPQAVYAQLKRGTLGGTRVGDHAWLVHESSVNDKLKGVNVPRTRAPRKAKART